MWLIALIPFLFFGYDELQPTCCFVESFSLSPRSLTSINVRSPYRSGTKEHEYHRQDNRESGHHHKSGHIFPRTTMTASPSVDQDPTSRDRKIWTNPELQPQSERFVWESQWYPVIPTNYLEGSDATKPIKVGVLGRDLVVWRRTESTDGEHEDIYAIFEDVCPHRRAPLSTGQVVKGCLVCRYHGWEFDTSGNVTKFPMRDESNNDDDGKTRSIRANSYASQVAGGLLWVYLGRNHQGGGPAEGAESIPPLPAEAIALPEDIDGADWMFNRNPISYTSMIENTFDPAHSPWTHEQMTGFAPGIQFSPLDAIPMQRYDVVEPPTVKGFALQHTPYQNSTAKVTGSDSVTVREFIPPCTVSVASPPFFTVKLWFVPASNPYETNVISYFRHPQNRWMKWTRPFPKLQSIVKDTQRTLQYLGDWNYRFLTQDRITMQGQDRNKIGTQTLQDMTPDRSDTGVATIQTWLQTVAGGGPFAASSTTFPAASALEATSTELSFWESHGKFSPACQRTMRRISQLKRSVSRWSTRLFKASIASALLTTMAGLVLNSLSKGGTVPLSTRCPFTRTMKMVRVLFSAFALNGLLTSIGLGKVADWCTTKERRMHSVGADLWPPNESVFGYRSESANT